MQDDLSCVAAGRRIHTSTMQELLDFAFFLKRRLVFVHCLGTGELSSATLHVPCIQALASLPGQYSCNVVPEAPGWLICAVHHQRHQCMGPMWINRYRKAWREHPGCCHQMVTATNAGQVALHVERPHLQQPESLQITPYLCDQKHCDLERARFLTLRSASPTLVS